MVTIENIEKFLSERKAEEIVRIKATQENIDPGFNAFALISDIYHRENFHSDIIRAILDVDGKHEGGNQYLLLFISMLNQYPKNPKITIDPNNYKSNVSVTRETGRRDITIIGENNRAIIIENKINDAGDTYNQIPSYVHQLESSGKFIDAIVYLTLNQAKEPNEGTWRVDGPGRIEIKNKLVSIRAYDGTPKDLCSGWLKKCIDISTHIDSLSILRQYYRILKYLTRNHMDHEYMKTFTEFLEQSPGNTEILLSIKKATDDLPWYICTEIYSYFKVDRRFLPFESIDVWKQLGYYLNSYRIGNCSFNMDIVVRNLECCAIDFSSRMPVYNKEYAEAVIKEIGLLNEFTWNNNGRFEYVIYGNFIEFKPKAIKFISSFLELLAAKMESIEAALLQLNAGNNLDKV